MKIKKYYVVAQSKGYRDCSFYVEAENGTLAIQKVVEDIINGNKSKPFPYSVTAIEAFNIEKTLEASDE